MIQSVREKSDAYHWQNWIPTHSINLNFVVVRQRRRFLNNILIVSAANSNGKKQAASGSQSIAFIAIHCSFEMWKMSGPLFGGVLVWFLWMNVSHIKINMTQTTTYYKRWLKYFIYSADFFFLRSLSLFHDAFGVDGFSTSNIRFYWDWPNRPARSHELFVPLPLALPVPAADAAITAIVTHTNKQTNEQKEK